MECVLRDLRVSLYEQESGANGGELIFVTEFAGDKRTPGPEDLARSTLGYAYRWRVLARPFS